MEKIIALVKILFVLVFFVGLGWGIYMIFIRDDGLVDCYYDSQLPNIFYKDITRDECEIEKYQREQDYQKMDEKGKEIGCSRSFNPCHNNYKTYEWRNSRPGFPANWYETEGSVICSPYVGKKVADLPIKCLDYFGIRK